jgi:hypothetical protein
VHNTLLPAAASSRAGLHAAGSGFPLRARAPLLQHAQAAVVLQASEQAAAAAATCRRPDARRRVY